MYQAWMFKFIETEKAGEYTRVKWYEMPTDIHQASKMIKNFSWIHLDWSILDGEKNYGTDSETPGRAFRRERKQRQSQAHWALQIHQ